MALRRVIEGGVSGFVFDLTDLIDFKRTALRAIAAVHIVRGNAGGRYEQFWHDRNPA